MASQGEDGSVIVEAKNSISVSSSITFVIGFLMEVLRVVLFYTRPVSDYVLDFFYHLIMGQTKVLPPIENKILLMSATDLAEKIRKREIKSEDVVRIFVERSRIIHSYINAAVDERYDDALEDARQVDKMLDSGRFTEDELADQFPLLGLPFSCKEAIGVKGMAQTCGMVSAKDRKAEKDSDTAALYRRAGAIPLTVTNVPEMCMWWESANHVFGMTKNPYDNARSVGGSTGGEGSILTAAGAVIGIGNDIAGSIRIPASFCGIYGHKPSRGLISNKGTFPDAEDEFDEFVSTGPMCRYAKDLPLLVKILSNNNSIIPWNRQIDFRKVKVYYIEEIPGLTACDTDIKNAIKTAAMHFKDKFGVQATQLDIDEMRWAFSIWECKLLECGGPCFKSVLAGDCELSKFSLHWELMKNIFGRSDHTLPALYFGLVDRRTKDNFYYECLQKYQSLKQKLDELLQGDAILLLPTQCEPPPHYLMTIPKYPNIGYTCIFSILGYPSTQVPAGLSRGLPIGIQVVGGPMSDGLTVSAAIELDSIFKGWICPCPTNV